jgi:hypothetical protein
MRGSPWEALPSRAFDCIPAVGGENIAGFARQNNPAIARRGSVPVPP